MSQTGTLYIEIDNMANSPQSLLDIHVRLPQLTANCWFTVSWNWPTVLEWQLFVGQQLTDKCVRKVIFTFSCHECCKLSNTYLYHNTLMSYQQGPPVLHFFSGDKRKWQYMVFLFCESMKTWRRKVNKVSLYSVQICFIPVVQFFKKYNSKTSINPVSPKSDQHWFSPYNITWIHNQEKWLEIEIYGDQFAEFVSGYQGFNKGLSRHLQEVW